MHRAIIVADLNGRIFQWLDRSGPLLTRSGGKPRRWPPTASPKRTLRACSAFRSRPCASIAVPSSTRVPPGPQQTEFFYSIKKEGTPLRDRVRTSSPDMISSTCLFSTESLRISLLYQKGRDSRIFQAQDRAIDDFTLKGKPRARRVPRSRG